MKRTIFIITALLGAGCMLNAQQTIGVTTDNLKIERNGEYIVVDMNMGLSPLDVESNRAVLLTPRFASKAWARIPAARAWSKLPSAWRRCTRRCSRASPRIRRSISKPRSTSTTRKWFSCATSPSIPCASIISRRFSAWRMWRTFRHPMDASADCRSSRAWWMLSRNDRKCRNV